MIAAVNAPKPRERITLFVSITKSIATKGGSTEINVPVIKRPPISIGAIDMNECVSYQLTIRERYPPLFFDP